MTREQAEVKLNVVSITAESLDSLVEIERLTRPAADHYSAQDVRELKAKLEKARTEKQEAQRQVELSDSHQPASRHSQETA